VDPLLPAPRENGGTTYRVAVVCLGNICRSPMARVVLTSRIRDARLDDRVEVESAGTGDWHVGKPMDRRAAAALAARGHDPSQHRAQQFGATWLEEYDLVLAMDTENLADITALGSSERVRLFRDFDPRATGSDRDVPDPYFGGDEGFDRVLAIVERSADRLVEALLDALPPESEPDGRARQD